MKKAEVPLLSFIGMLAGYVCMCFLYYSTKVELLELKTKYLYECKKEKTPTAPAAEEKENRAEATEYQSENQ